MPAITSPKAVAAVRNVLPLGERPAANLTTSVEATVLPVQRDLIATDSI